MQRWICGAVVSITLAGAAVVPRPMAAFPASPLPTDVICRARPPRLAHAYAAGLDFVEPGSVVRVAAAALPSQEHAELMLKLGLLEGHLMVGRELIEAGEVRLALPHFGHPVRELYDDISAQLKKRGISAFDGELIALEALAAGRPRDPATAAKQQQVIQILAAVRATVPSPLQDNERFMLGVLGEVAATAAEDYGEAIESGRIEKAVEYHDSRGYLAYASKELSRMEGRPDLRTSPRVATARARLTEMQAIVGPLLPPARPLRSVAAYQAIVAQFKQVIPANGA